MDANRVLHRIAPEVFDIVQQRYQILRTTHYRGPIGRRGLAQVLDKSERTIRREVDLLKEQGFLLGSYSGMQLSPEGERILVALDEYIRAMYGLAGLEQQLREILKIDHVVVVPGDLDQDPVVKQDMAKAAAKYLRQGLQDGDVLAVTGGTTLSEVANSLPAQGAPRDVVVVAARGGLGEDVNIQANSIAARLAQGLGGRYRLLHAPDTVDSKSMEAIMNVPRIKEVIALGRRAQVLLLGIGTAEEIAKRRGLDEDHLMQLIADGAVGEAFGYYFDTEGRVVYATSSVGLRMEDLDKIPQIVAVGGGRSKAWALLSVVNTKHCDVCITDEGAARRLMTLLKNKEE